ncbi:polysaccharide pyruvyl transferase family protein [Pseudoruegeria sp. SHC-113]|uniref:polysaccharide pyruvyl transferase family protein n=1 Tax=Pseudoruegeria sp. SHC-113 TaxID=2855439 RepID=UPI0021BAEB4C|nr:polysaccharide pyruvyl transferase family protein [Pseudoruegeria sp. SHC-113]MCT8160148.1 polysaccharide pyruvyl transferase family protein [Pseudoruegeria sp. SHC-113]
MTFLEAPVRLAMTGVFDMANFGDALFPLVASHALSAYGIGVQTVAPTAQRVPLADAHQPIGLSALDALLDDSDGLLIGGGHVLHAHPLDLMVEYRGLPEAGWAGPGLWLGAGALAARKGLPVMFNAPGMPHPLPGRWHALARAVAGSSAYLALRDTGSADLLAKASGHRALTVPDTIAALPGLWPRASLAPLAKAFRQREGIAAQEAVVCIHVRDRSLSGTSAHDVAEGLDAAARAMGARLVLCALGRAHEDERTAAAIADHMTTRPIVYDQPPSLQEMAAVLAHARAYLGASLHGFVVAHAYGVPSMLVARPAYRKFSGYLQWIGEPDLAVGDWAQGLGWLRRVAPGAQGAGIPAAVDAALAAHWQRIAQITRQTRHQREQAGSPGQTAQQAPVQAFLARLGLEQAGIEDIMKAIQSEGMQSSGRAEPGSASPHSLEAAASASGAPS